MSVHACTGPKWVGANAALRLRVGRQFSSEVTNRHRCSPCTWLEDREAGTMMDPNSSIETDRQHLASEHRMNEDQRGSFGVAAIHASMFGSRRI